MASNHWDHNILRVNGKETSLCQLTESKLYSEEALENSMRGTTSITLVLGSLALSIQARITLYSPRGQLVGRYAPLVNPGALRYLPKIDLIQLEDKLHGTWPLATAHTILPSTALVRRPHPSNAQSSAYWKGTSNLPPNIEFEGARIGSIQQGDILIASLNVDGLDSWKFEEILAYMDTQSISIMVLQDTRCTQSQSRYYGEQLKQRLGRQAKLFNVEGLAPLNKRGEKKTVRVGGQMFLTDHRVGIYTNDFSPDPTGLGVLSSITITSREAGIGLKVLGTYWPPPNTLDGSLGRQLSLSTNFLHLASQQRSPLTPKQYLQICADKISDTYCSKPNHYAILAGDFNCVWDPLPERTLGAHGHGLKLWATTSSWRHPITTLGFGEFVPAQWISHFSRDGTQGTSWIDHLLVKGSANIRPNYLGIDHSGYWLNVSDHRPVIMGLTAPAFSRLHNSTSTPKGSLQFPRNDVKPDYYSVSNFYHKMLQEPKPALSAHPTLHECQAAYTQVLTASRKSLPKQSKKKVRNPHKDGWSPIMAALKAQTNMLHRIQWHLGTGGADSKCRWNTIEKREEGLIRVTTTWEEEVRGLNWPEENGVKTVDPKVWTFGSSIADWRTTDLHNPSSLRQRCIVDLRTIKRATPGRKRTEFRIATSAAQARREADRKRGKLESSFNSILGRGTQNSSAMEDIDYKHPVTGEAWYPNSAEELNTVLRSHFTAAFAEPSPDPTHPDQSPLTWESIQNWEEFRRHCSHHHVPDCEETSILKQLWRAMSKVKHRDQVEAELTEASGYCPSFAEFEQSLKQKAGGTAGGPSGITYHTVKMWPTEWRETAYNCMVGFWTHHGVAKEWQWRWLVPLLKKGGSTIQDLRPIMLLDVLRKLWTTLVMSSITSVLLKHKVLRATQHAYLPHRGTDSANMQVINTLETAFDEKRTLYGSSWDIRKAFDSVGKWLIRLAWRRLGVPAPLVEWLILLDLDNHTVVRTGHAFSRWMKHGLKGLDGLDFDAKMGCGQGDVSSPLTWVAVFDILLSVLEDDDPRGGFRLRRPNGTQYAAPDVCFADDLQSFAATLKQLQRKAELVAGYAAITGMQIAEQKLRTYHIRGQQDDLRRASIPEGLWIYDHSWSPTWVPFKDEHCFKSLGVWYDTTERDQHGTQFELMELELQTMMRRVRTARGSAEAITEVLRGAIISKVSYYGGLSQWSLDETRALDALFTASYRQVTKNMATSPQESLFQPCSSGGYGFPRLSHVIQDRKLALLAGIHEHGDHYTRWAAAAIEHRGITEHIGHAPTLSRIRPGFWISSIVEYTLEGGVVLAQGRVCATTSTDRLTDPTWRASLTPKQRQYLDKQNIQSQTDLVTLDQNYDLTTWQENPDLPPWLQKILPDTPTPMTPLTPARGQIWHVQQGGTIIGIPGETFSIIDVQHFDHASPAAALVYKWTLEALRADIGNSISLSQQPSAVLVPLHELFPHDYESRLLTVSRDLPRTKKQRSAIKDSRQRRKSLVITGLQRTPPPHLHPRPPQEDAGPIAPPLLGDVCIYVGHVHAPTLVQDQLNDHPTPMTGSLATYQSGEWRLQRFTSSEGPAFIHASSYRTLLYALILRVVSDYKDSPDQVKIHVPHRSILNRLDGSTKMKLRHITQLTLLRRIHDLASPSMTFHWFSPLSRLAQYHSSWTLDRWGSYWVGNWRTEHAGAAPGHVKEETLQSLLSAEAQGTEWLPFDRTSGILEMAPIGCATTEARRIRALVTRDASRRSRGATNYWDSNTFKLASRVLCLPEASIAQRGHRIRQLDRRNWSVGSNRIKKLTPDSDAWRAEGHCKLCLLHMDSYDHIYRECPGADLVRIREQTKTGLLALHPSLPPGEQALAVTLLALSEEPDGYRIGLGDLSHRQRQLLKDAYWRLERPTDHDADTTFLRQIRLLNHGREALWAERGHVLDPSTHQWSDDLPKGSKWFVVYRGKACGVYADYDLAKSQTLHVSGGMLRGFPDEAAAGVADQQRQSLERHRLQDTIQISVYTDGSYTPEDPAREQSDLAGWGFLAIHRKDDCVIHQDCNHVHLDPAKAAFHGATLRSNNTGEVTAIGEALEWIREQPHQPELSYEICSDSYYAIDGVDVMPERDSAPLRNGVLLQWAYDSLALGRAVGHIIRFRKVKAHLTDNSIDSRRNRQADQLANNGRLMDLSAYVMLATAGPALATSAAWADIDVLPSQVALPANQTPTDHEAAILLRAKVRVRPVSHAANQSVTSSSHRESARPSPALHQGTVHPATPMLTATQPDTTHPPSMSLRTKQDHCCTTLVCCAGQS